MTDKPPEKAPKHYRMRFSGPADRHKVIEFYKTNPHEHIDIRDEMILTERINNGAVVMLEDTDGKLHGASISYPLSTDGENRWTEIGSTRVTLNGFGLLPYMFAAQLIHTFMFEPPEDRFVLETHDKNKKMQGLLKKMDWMPFNAPKAMHDAAQGTKEPDSVPEKVFWYQSGPEHLPQQARKLLELVENPVLENRDGEKIHIDTSQMPAVKALKKQVHDLANRRIGNVEKPRPWRKLGKLHRSLRV